MRRAAVISACGMYRFRLSRHWRDDGPPRAVFLMLNPSTADATEDDPTIRRCIGFARSWGCGGLEVVNLFPWRATSPKDLVTADRAGHDIRCREERDDHIRRALCGLTIRVVAWGAHPLAGPEWAHVCHIFRQPMALGVTKTGQPRHPLYMPKASELRRWPTGFSS